MKSRLNVLPIIALLLMTAVPVEAKTPGRITGKIKSEDGQGILGAVVTIFKESAEGGVISFTRTDRLGAFLISNLSPGSYYLQVSREGYRPVTQSDVRIDQGKSSNLDIVLQEILDFVSDDSDPRNWDLRTVMRSTSDRRLVFRNLEGSGDGPSIIPRVTRVNDETGPAENFTRNATLNVASSAGLGSENYSVFPSSGHNGIISNFAFSEPLSDQSRMIFSGQLNSGYDSLWRVRNTYDYRPEPGRETRVSVGYGRLSLNSTGPGSVGRPAQFFTRDSGLRESGAQTVTVGMESRHQILTPIVLEYGLDYSRVYYGSTKSIFSPMFQVIFMPGNSWTLKAGMTSRRVSENNLVTMPDGDMINLMEPTYIAQIEGDLRLSQFKHSEISVAKELDDATSVEFALYEDHMEGPGTPFMFTSHTQKGRSARVTQLREDQAAHHGARLVMNRRFLDFLSGSIAYVYGTGATLSSPGETLSSDVLARRLLNYIHRSYFHAFASQVDATIPRTKTQVSTIVRWYPGTSLSPIDHFWDRRDTLSKGINFFVRQAIPLPDFMGTVGRWEALVDVRNLFDQNKDSLRTSDGELIVTRNPRSVRFGLNLSFY